MIAVIVVCALVILLVGFKGGDMLALMQGKRLLRELKAVENALWEYKDKKRYWPGDCDRDGKFAYLPEHVVQASVQLSPAVVPKNESCQSEFAEEDQNSIFSDLRMARLWVYGAPNNVAAKHTGGGVFHVGSAQLATGKVNVMVVYNVTVRLAKMLDVQLDGAADGRQGRIRRWDEKAAGTSWPGDDDQRVAAAFFFDQIP
ncbi:MAG: hypothetical protein AABY83_08110 [Pseudomonadota bacterium]